MEFNINTALAMVMLSAFMIIAAGGVQKWKKNNLWANILGFGGCIIFALMGLMIVVHL